MRAGVVLLRCGDGNFVLRGRRGGGAELVCQACFVRVPATLGAALAHAGGPAAQLVSVVDGTGPTEPRTEAFAERAAQQARARERAAEWV